MTDPGTADRPTAEDGGELRCPSCGRVLARVAQGRSIATAEAEFAFTRRTDHLLCDGCDAVVPIHEVRGDLPPRA